MLVALKRIFPKADVFTSFYNPKALGIHAEKFRNWNIVTSWADKVPLLKRLYSPLRFITPQIWEGFDFGKYQLVISSSGSYMSKGVVTKPPTKHVCYLHHPPRYLYYYETAIEWQKYWPVKVYGHLINHHLRLYDYLSSQRVDQFIANSKETQKRIAKFYRRDSTVIYPPVSLPEPQPANPPTLELSNSLTRQPVNYYLTVSRLARAKHVDVLIDAANQRRFQLKVVGSGRDAGRLRSLAGPTVEVLEHVDDQALAQLYRNARAYLFAAVDEEFGIAPVEAMGYGLPVIAYASGGLKETVTNGKNGYLYHRLSPESLVAALTTLDKLSDGEYQQMRRASRQAAEKYTETAFKQNILRFVAGV